MRERLGASEAEVERLVDDDNAPPTSKATAADTAKGKSSEKKKAKKQKGRLSLGEGVGVYIMHGPIVLGSQVVTRVTVRVGRDMIGWLPPTRMRREVEVIGEDQKRRNEI